MDIETQQQEIAAVHAMGVFSIYAVSTSLIYTLKKPISLIFLTLVLPFSFMSIAPGYIVPIIFHGKHMNTLESFLVSASTLLAQLPFASMSAAAIAHAIASLNTPPGEAPSFLMSFSVVPRVWKRVGLTIACNYISSYLLKLLLPTLDVLSSRMSRGQVSIFIMYGLGYVWNAIVWQMAAVISVLDRVEAKALSAALKAVHYLFRRRKVLVGIMLTFNFLLLQFGSAFLLSAEYRNKWEEILFAGLCVLIWAVLNLIQFVVQTVLYSVCRPTEEEEEAIYIYMFYIYIYLQQTYMLIVGAGILTCFTS